MLRHSETHTEEYWLTFRCIVFTFSDKRTKRSRRVFSKQSHLTSNGSEKYGLLTHTAFEFDATQTRWRSNKTIRKASSAIGFQAPIRRFDILSYGRVCLRLSFSVWLCVCVWRCEWVSESTVEYVWEYCAYKFAHPSSLAISQRSILGDQRAIISFVGIIYNRSLVVYIRRFNVCLLSQFTAHTDTVCP